VDTVAVERVRDLWSTYGDALARRVATAAEAAWAGAAPERYAALLAVKESAVKALGGRPPGFRWQSIELLRPRSASSGAVSGGPEPVPAAVGGTLSAFAAGVRLGDESDVACRLTGVGLDRARTVLGAGPGAAIRGAARHGTLDGHVLAVVSFWED
jgi:holo-[acyl-carrier protein] synthase